MSVPRSRIVDLLRTQSKIFNTTFNPSRLRTGNKILRQRLVGPTVASYYTPRFVIFRDVQKAYSEEDGYELYDEREAYFAEKAVIAKARGKGAPKKKRTKAESKKFKGGRKSNISAAAAALAAGGSGGGKGKDK